MSNTYSLINYFDVRGNPQDGYEVNDQCVEFTVLVITEVATDKDILEYLVSIGFLATADRRRLVVEDNGDFIEIYERKGMKPICSLRDNSVFT